jgi:hypothetical protein
MPLNSIQRSQFVEWLGPQFELLKRIERIVEILLGDIRGEPPATLQKFFEKHGISEEHFDQMSTDERIEAMHKIWETQETKTDNVIAALDMIFEARYGWPEGTVANMAVGDVFLALEHATDFDDPWKSSIWEITK